VSPNVPPSSENEEFWRDFLSRGHSKERAGRRVFKLIPHDPRCRLCAAPFSGAGAPLMRLIGKKPSDKNPNWCSSCFTFMTDNHGGAEIECTLLFADIRGSTTLAEGMAPADFRRLMDRFYDTAAAVVFDHDGIALGIDAARKLLEATGHGEQGGPWVPLGAGVHTGTAWVGAVGAGTHTTMTALGDAVNTAARLASVATAGEILVTIDAATAAGLDSNLEQRRLELKGKEDLVEIVTLTVSPGVKAG
jgi:adenylate cyclase